MSLWREVKGCGDGEEHYVQVSTVQTCWNYVCLLCIITGAISVCMLVHIQGCMCVCMFVYRVVMIGDGATDMEAAPPAVSPKMLTK